MEAPLGAGGEELTVSEFPHPPLPDGARHAGVGRQLPPPDRAPEFGGAWSRIPRCVGVLPILGDIRRSPNEVGEMAKTETFKVSTSGQMSLPATVRHRWRLDDGGFVEVIDLGFGVLTVPVGEAGRLLDRVLPAADHYAAVAAEDDPDLRS